MIPAAALTSTGHDVAALLSLDPVTESSNASTLRIPPTSVSDDCSAFHATTDCCGDGRHSRHQLVEFGEVEGLVAIREGVVRAGMDLDHQAVGSGSDAGQGQRADERPLAGGM